MNANARFPVAATQVILATGSAEKLCQELGYNVLGETVPCPSRHSTYSTAQRFFLGT